MKKTVVWIGAGLAALSLTACSKNNPVAPQETQARHSVRAQSVAYVESLEYWSDLYTGYRMNSPRGVAVNQTTGEVYIADTGNNRIKKFSSWGGPLLVNTAIPFKVDDPTITLRTMSAPTNIAFDPFSGGVYVSDTFNNRILVLNQDTLRVVKEIKAPNSGSGGQVDFFKQPLGVLPMTRWDRYGFITRLHVCDGFNRNLRILDISSHTGANLVNMALDKFFYTRNGNAYVGAYKSPDYIIMDNNAKFWISDNLGAQVVQIDPAYPRSALKVLYVTNPTGLAVDKNNILFVSDFCNNQLRVFGSDGLEQMVALKSKPSFPGFHTPCGLAIDQKNDTLYVCDMGSSTVYKFVIHYTYK